ncbi:hypothetical protein THASP1DRAFT_30591 [Thamnocephalis sphaerospora]|uniref:Uncharacterized protein n=1 Tax=Thamnocephalis sphaerospora TaxID=78915 RepID=A0A4P9XNQ7_9FUNG|nr:hypothetical protein THASP1DRAFT_30591 [Thamnocephalis sphaerospora]|eukprot:RKP07596.1 hypothetical protein THASP1DRAFT_30591 [Thamnocephalis sphaerospora]
MPEDFIETFFKGAFGVPRVTFYVLGACCIVLALLHGWRLFATKSWAHATMSMGFIFNGANAFTIAAMSGISSYISIFVYPIYHITLAVLIAQWATSMQHEIGGNAKGARIAAYISIGLMALVTIASIIITVIARLNLFDMYYIYHVASDVIYGVSLGNAVLLCLVAIWMFLVCPKESKVAGSNKKRWQIGMAVVVGLLFVLYTVLARLSYGIVTFVFVLLLGIVTLYPVHTLSGHAKPPASSHNPETSPVEV